MELERKEQRLVEYAFEEEEWSILLRDANFLEKLREVRSMRDAEALVDLGLHLLSNVHHHHSAYDG